MKEKISILIDETIEEFSADLEKALTEEERKVIKGRIINKVKIKIKEDMKIDLFNHPDDGLISQIKKEVDEKTEKKQSREEPKQETEEEVEEVENEIDLNDKDVFSIIKAFEREIKVINKLQQKGKYAEATAKSGRLITKLRKKIKMIKESEDVKASDLELLEKIEVFLDEQIEWHKNQLKGRYKKEFSEKPATVEAIFTVLPHGIALQAKRVINCIDQIKEAKTNKERIFGILELGKQMGILALTPVTFTVKFIIKHWYLLLLLLLLLRLPGFSKPGQKKPTEDDLNLQPQEQEALEPAGQPALEPAQDPALQPVPETIPGLQPVPERDPGLQPVPIPEGVPETIPVPETVPGQQPHPVPRPPRPELKPGFRPGLQPQIVDDPVMVADNGTGTVPQPVQPTVPAVNPGTIPGVPDTVIVTEPEVGTIPPTLDPSLQNAISVDLSAEQAEAANKVANDFVYNLEHNFRFFVASNHPDTIIVHSAEEYVEAVRNINPFADINVSNAADFYQRYATVGPMSGAIEQPVLWPEADSMLHYFETNEALANYIISGQDPNLTSYYQEFAARSGSSDSYALIQNSGLTNQIASALGVSTEAAIVIFCLYELVQYGLAIPTGGASLVLPG